MDRLDPARLRQRTPLRIRDRNHRQRGERVEHRLMLRQIEPAVQRRDERCRLAGEQRERIIIEMEVQEVELARPAAAPVPASPCAARSDRGSSRPDAARAARTLRACADVRELPLANSVTSWPSATSSSVEPVNDPFGSAVELGWDRFGQRSDLSNAHEGAPHRIEKSPVAANARVLEHAYQSSIRQGNNFARATELLRGEAIFHRSAPARLDRGV